MATTLSRNILSSIGQFLSFIWRKKLCCFTLIFFCRIFFPIIIMWFYIKVSLLYNCVQGSNLQHLKIWSLCMWDAGLTTEIFSTGRYYGAYPTYIQSYNWSGATRGEGWNFTGGIAPPLIWSGVYKVPYNLIFFPTPIFFKSWFSSQKFPSPFPHLIFFPTA